MRYTINRMEQDRGIIAGMPSVENTRQLIFFIIKVTYKTSMGHKINTHTKCTCCICSGKGPSEFSIMTDGIGPHLLLVLLRTVSLACLVFGVWVKEIERQMRIHPSILNCLYFCLTAILHFHLLPSIPVFLLIICFSKVFSSNSICDNIPSFFISCNTLHD